MDLALKQRLIGAIVLVVLAVIFVPMLLDGEPPSGVSSHDLQIPPPSQPHLTTVTLDLDQDLGQEDKQEAAVEESVSQAEALQVLAEASESVQNDPIAAQEDAIAKLELSPKLQPKLQPESQSKSQSQPDVIEQKVDAKQQSTVQVPVRDAEPAKQESKEIRRSTRQQQAQKNNDAPSAKTYSTTPAVNPSPKGQGYILVLGSFSKKSNASALVDKLSKAHFKPHLDQVSIAGKKLHRVWLGEVSRSEAKQLQSEVKKVAPKINSRIISVSTSAESLSTQSQDKPVSENLRSWVVQVGVFSRKSNAVKLRDRVRKRDLRAYVEELEVKGKKSYRVRVGPYLEKKDASAAMEGLRKLGITGYLTKHQ